MPTVTYLELTIVLSTFNFITLFLLRFRLRPPYGRAGLPNGRQAQSPIYLETISAHCNLPLSTLFENLKL